MSRNSKLIIAGIVILAIFAPILFGQIVHNLIDSIKVIWQNISSTGIFNGGTGGG